MINFCYSIVRSYFTDENGKYDSFNGAQTFALLMFFGLTGLLNIILFPFSLGASSIMFSAGMVLTILIIHMIIPGYECKEKFLTRTRAQINLAFIYFTAIVLTIFFIAVYLNTLQFFWKLKFNVIMCLTLSKYYSKSNNFLMLRLLQLNQFL